MTKSVTYPLHRAILAGNAIELHRLIETAEAQDPTYAKELFLRLEDNPLGWQKREGENPQSVVESALWMAILKPSSNQDDVVTVVEHWMTKFLKNPDVGWNQWVDKVHLDAMQFPQSSEVSSSVSQFLALPSWLTESKDYRRSSHSVFYRLTRLMACQPTHTIGYRWLKRPLPISDDSMVCPLFVVKNFVWGMGDTSWPIAPAMMKHLWSDWIQSRPPGSVLAFDDIKRLLINASHGLCRELWDWVVNEANVSGLLTPANISTLWRDHFILKLKWLQELIQEHGFHPIVPSENSENSLEWLFYNHKKDTLYAYLEEYQKSLSPENTSEWVTLLNRVYAQPFETSLVHIRQLWKWTAQMTKPFLDVHTGQVHSALQDLVPASAFTGRHSLCQWSKHLRTLYRLTKKEKNILLPFLEKQLTTMGHPLGIWDALYSRVCEISSPFNIQNNPDYINYLHSQQHLLTCLKFLNFMFPLSPDSASTLIQRWNTLNNLNLDPMSISLQKMLLSHVENVALTGEMALMEKIKPKMRL